MNTPFADMHLIEHSLAGAKVYEKLGKASKSKVKKWLLRALKEDGGIESKNPLVKEVRNFLKRNSDSGGLENKTMLVVSLLGVVVSIFFLSPNLTGNVVGSLSKSGSNVFGIIMFVLGLLGIYVSFKK